MVVVVEEVDGVKAQVVVPEWKVFYAATAVQIYQMILQFLN